MTALEKRKALGAKRAKVTYLILHEMKIRGFGIPGVARIVGVSRPAVSRVINGRGHSSQILDVLRAIGVPEELLFDPRNDGAPSLQKKRRA